MKYMILVFAFLSSLAFSQIQPSGSGTSGDPYIINTLDNLQWVSENSSAWSAYYLQTSDIDASSTGSWNGGTGWSPIGNGWDTAFFGHYNGGGHFISGLSIQRNGSYQAFIGVARDGSISDLILTGALIIESGNNSKVGVLAGECQGTMVTNCRATGIINGSGTHVGGLIGLNGGTVSGCSFEGTVSDDLNGSNYFGGLIGYNTGLVQDSYSSATVTGNWYAGGLIGYNNSGTVERCYSASTDGDYVFGSYYTGGLTGYNTGSASISGSYSTLNVTGYANYAGGLTGGNNSSTISNCYSQGTVTRLQGSDGDFGSFIGKNEYTTIITNCYAAGEVIYDGASNPTDKGFIGNYNSTGCSENFFDSQSSAQIGGAGAAPKNTAEMKTLSTFTGAGWDFSTPVWKMTSTMTYPFLGWQPSAHIEFDVNPTGVSRTNGVDGDYPAGTELHLVAEPTAPGSSYAFENWTDGSSNIISEEMEFLYTVTGSNDVLTANYFYTGGYGLNLRISNDGSNVILTWDPLFGAAYYQVFSGSDPYGSFLLDETGIFDGTSWTAPMPSNKRFYCIVAFDGN